MQVISITNVQDFEKLQPVWDEVYASDPYSTVFVSWAWLRAWIEVTKDPWLVLAVRINRLSSYVAFIALGKNVGKRRLYMGGNPLSDHTGFICRPEYELEAIGILATFIQQKLEWDKFEIRDVFDPKIDFLLNAFYSSKFDITCCDPTPCPYILLPENWDQHLKLLSNNTRWKVRRSFREIEKLNSFRVSHAREENLEDQITILLTLWRRRWGEMPEDNLNKFRTLFRITFKHDCLRLVVFWNDKTPIGAEAAFVDWQKKVICDYINCFNHEFDGIHSPGQAVNALNIREAIECGFKIYDYCRGSEPYKFSLGATERFNSNVTIQRQYWRRRIKNILKTTRKTVIN